MTRGPNGRRARGTLSRRDVLAGAAVAALAVSAPAALAAGGRAKSRNKAVSAWLAPMRRYMAASAVLEDGRVLVTGGYDRPFRDGDGLKPVSSASLFDPASGTWSAVAPMRTPRARHAAVTLPDGRVAVIGGLGLNPTASVEIYDPKTNAWSAAAPLAQPRYDHSAAVSNGRVYVIGGSSQSMLSSVEAYDPAMKTGTGQGY